MKLYLLIFLYANTVFGQQSNLPDSGFTNKAEATNLYKDSLKEGKWIEYSIFKYKNGAIDTTGYWLNVYRDGILYGIVRGYNKKGVLESEEPYTDGKLDGILKRYWENGLVSEEKSYAKGKIVGFKSYYKNGAVDWIAPFIDNKENGLTKEYWDNGILMSEVPYVNDIKEGLQKDYYQSGKLKRTALYSNGKLNGSLTMFYENGEVEIKSDWVNDTLDGHSKHYYENGQLSYEGLYSSGKRNGLIRWYYKDGKLNWESTYTNDKANGIAKKYYESGKLQSEITYANGDISSTKNYDEKGNVITLQTGWYYIADSGKAYELKLDKANEIYSIDPTPIVAVKDFTTIQIDKSNLSDEYLLTIHFNDTATKAWNIATRKSIGNRLAFILDNKLLFTPKVNNQINSGVSALNRGDISKEDLEKIKVIIEGEEK
ncbi:MAG TPA: hypothetical protein VK783_16330 [Bacteroidia bacterium]|nr:hypothetical protein [Bacteroidia bacterium]